MNELFKDMKERGLITVSHETYFEKFPYLNETQRTAWLFLDGKFALVTRMKLQHAILPCQINEWSRN